MEEIVPQTVLFTIDGWEQGLRGTYYRGEELQGQPMFDQVDPLILFAWPDPEPWFGPFSARWLGEIEAPQSGMYAFKVSGDDGVRFYLDGQLLGDEWVPDRPNDVSVQQELTQGRHTLQIDFFQRGGAKVLEFWWQTPGQRWTPVPPSRLYPATRGEVTFVQPEAAPRPSPQSSSPQISVPAVPLPPLEARRIFTGTIDSDVWEVPVGRVVSSDGKLVIRILPVPGFDAVYDYVRVIGSDGEEQVFEAEDGLTTTGDEYAERHVPDGHWWLQTFGVFSNRQALVALGGENAPHLTTTLPLPDGEYDLYLGTFTGDPAHGPFAIAVDYD